MSGRRELGDPADRPRRRVDFSLFYLRREREERAAGRSESAALGGCRGNFRRAVIVSGITVMIAMAGMYMTGDATFASFATGTIIVVAVAVLRFTDRAAGRAPPGSATGLTRAGSR